MTNTHRIINVLLLSGAIAHIDSLHVDWHLWADWQVLFILVVFLFVAIVVLVDIGYI